MQWILPKQQGDLDGACGFYSVANATQLVTGVPTTDESFRQVVCGHTQTNRQMLPWDLLMGVDRAEMNNLLVSYLPLGVSIHRPFWKRRPDLSEYWETVLGHLASPKTAAIVAFHHERPNDLRSHWTVVRSATNKSFELYDSAGSQRIIRKHSRILTKKKQTDSSRPIAFEATSTFLLMG
jgi:hypothetical protein